MPAWLCVFVCVYVVLSFYYYYYLLVGHLELIIDFSPLFRLFSISLSSLDLSQKAEKQSISLSYNPLLTFHFYHNTFNFSSPFFVLLVFFFYIIQFLFV